MFEHFWSVRGITLACRGSIAPASRRPMANPSFKKIGMLAAAIVGLSSLALFGQQNDRPDREGPTAGDRPADHRPGGPRSTRRPEGDARQDHRGENGEMADQLRQLRDQVGRLTQQLEKLQASVAQGQRSAGENESKPERERNRFGWFGLHSQGAWRQRLMSHSHGQHQGLFGMRGFGRDSGQFQGKDGWHHRHHRIGMKTWGNGFGGWRHFHGFTHPGERDQPNEGNDDRRSRGGEGVERHSWFGGGGTEHHPWFGRNDNAPSGRHFPFMGGHFGRSLGHGQGEGNSEDGDHHASPRRPAHEESSGDAGGAGPESSNSNDAPNPPHRRHHHSEDQPEQ